MSKILKQIHFAKEIHFALFLLSLGQFIFSSLHFLRFVCLFCRSVVGMLTHLRFACSGLFVSRCLVSFTQGLSLFLPFCPVAFYFCACFSFITRFCHPLCFYFHAFLSCNYQFRGGLFKQCFLFIQKASLSWGSVVYLKRLLLRLFIIGEGDLLLRGNSLGVPPGKSKSKSKSIQ